MGHKVDSKGNSLAGGSPYSEERRAYRKKEAQLAKALYYKRKGAKARQLRMVIPGDNH